MESKKENKLVTIIKRSRLTSIEKQVVFALGERKEDRQDESREKEVETTGRKTGSRMLCTHEE